MIQAGTGKCAQSDRLDPTIVIDLDSGVKTNYPKFGAALKKIAGLEASGE